MTVFELDRPDLLALKAYRLTGALHRAERVGVGVDLAGDWPTELRAAGHDPAQPTPWIIEGLLQYLPEAAVLELLDAVTGCSAPGSRLLLDVVGARVMRDEAARPVLAAMAVVDDRPHRLGVAPQRRAASDHRGASSLRARSSSCSRGTSRRFGARGEVLLGREVTSSCHSTSSYQETAVDCRLVTTLADLVNGR